MRNPIISYMILAPNEMQAEPDERKSAKVCLETIQLDPELYRIGHTKARSNKLEPKTSNRYINQMRLPSTFHIVHFYFLFKLSRKSRAEK